MEKNLFNGWHKFPLEIPLQFQRCLVIYKLKSSTGNEFIQSSIVQFISLDIHKQKWRLFKNGPPIEYWKPMSELPNDYSYE